jgi:hypothetical protein
MSVDVAFPPTWRRGQAQNIKTQDSCPSPECDGSDSSHKRVSYLGPQHSGQKHHHNIRASHRVSTVRNAFVRSRSRRNYAPTIPHTYHRWSPVIGLVALLGSHGRSKRRQEIECGCGAQKESWVLLFHFFTPAPWLPTICSSWCHIAEIQCFNLRS